MANVSGTFKDKEYAWNEVGGNSGGGPRSLKISGAGLGKNGVEFDISPNPHSNPTYNNGSQAKFYQSFASEIEKGWPTKAKATFKEAKSIEDMPKDQRPKNYQALKKDKQKAAVKTYNTEGKAAAEALVQSTYESAVSTHVNGKSGTTITLGNMDHTIS